MPDPAFMLRAIQLAREGMLAGSGGPFGAVIVSESGTIIGEGCNRVLSSLDPTAHGEVVAIRAACQHLQSFSLAGCDIYTTGEPCPMCLGAIHWARLSRIYYGFSITDAATVGFDDATFYQEASLPPSQRKIPIASLNPAAALALLEEYRSLPGRTPY